MCSTHAQPGMHTPGIMQYLPKQVILGEGGGCGMLEGASQIRAQQGQVLQEGR